MEVNMDNEELEALVKKTLALAEENNKILRGMRSSARWGRFFSIVWWVIVLAVTGAAYYYAQPYLQQAEQLYHQIGQTNQQAQSYGQELFGILKQIKQPGAQ